MEKRAKYPILFVHGMFGWGRDEGINDRAPYWGTNAGRLVDYLAEAGYEAYDLSVGPVSSAWDRACEMYACLTGKTVDYGKAHAEKYGHRRYGRTYETPLLEHFSAEHKVHLVGHSFGGMTVRMFAHLMAFGAPEAGRGALRPLSRRPCRLDPERVCALHAAQRRDALSLSEEAASAPAV